MLKFKVVSSGFFNNRNGLCCAFLCELIESKTHLEDLPITPDIVGEKLLAYSCMVGRILHSEHIWAPIVYHTLQN